MKTYTEMSRKELMECLEMASEDAHADAKRQRWTKHVLIEWLKGHAELTDEPVTMTGEQVKPEVMRTETEIKTVDGKRVSVEINGKIVTRKVTTYARSGRSWVRHGKGMYFEVIERDNGTYVGVPWQD